MEFWILIPVAGIAAAARAELEALRAQANILDPALAAPAEPILALDQSLEVRFVNHAAEELFGEQPPTGSLFSYSRSLELERLAEDALETESPDALIRNIRIEDRPFEARAVRVANGIGIALSDIAELQRLSRARQDFIANLSHELNTPLTSLRLLLDTMRTRAGKDPKRAEELAEQMTVEVDAVQQMTEEMLDLAAIESGMQVVRLIDTPLRDLVEDIAARQRDPIERKGISLIIAIEPGLAVLADPEQAGRAILNVLNNAVKFTPESGEIRFSAEAGDDSIVLSIADTGSGIPPAELNRIFERFYRVRGSTGQPGTGLGLAIAHHIMLAHAGRIWAENRTPPEQGAILHLQFRAA